MLLPKIPRHTLAVFALAFATTAAAAPLFEPRARDLQAEVAAAARDGKTLAVLFEMRDCQPCAALKKNVFPDRSAVHRFGKEFRTVLNKFAKLGHQVERHPPPLPAGLLGELRAVSDAWLTERRGRELRFATGWFDDDYLRGSPVVTLRAPDGALSGFANAYPLYQAAGWGVDLMRRRPEALPGTMDLLFISLFDWVICLESDKKFEKELKKMTGQKVADICSTDVLSVSSEDDVSRVADIMTSRKVNALPVVDAGRLVGIVARIDLIRAMV